MYIAQDLQSWWTEAVLYEVEGGEDGKEAVMIQSLDLTTAYEEWAGRPSFSYDTGKYVFQWLQNETHYKPFDCRELHNLGLPAYSPCKSKEEDIIEPPLSKNIYQVEHRGHFEYLMTNFDSIFIHFQTAGEDFWGDETVFREGVSEGYDNYEAFKEAMIATTTTGNSVVQQIFQELADETANERANGVVAFALTPGTSTKVGKALGDLYVSKTLVQNDDWYAIDACNINFGMRDLFSPCMVGEYDGKDPRGLRLDCMGPLGSLGDELDCKGTEADEYEELKEEYAKKVARAKMVA